MVELLKQGQYKPFDVIDQCISIFAASAGFLDDVPSPAVSKFETGLRVFRDPEEGLRVVRVLQGPRGPVQGRRLRQQVSAPKRGW
jgi:F0F1-type ATP synthase alpha subunit